MRRLRLMHDWFCWPLWSDDPEGNVDPRDLPIEDGLVDRLEGWTTRYDSFLDLDDPAATTIDREAMHQLKREAFDLWIQLRAALPMDEYQVDFQWARTCFTHPSELPPDWVQS